MDKLKTATGKEFDCDYFNPFPEAGQINIRVLGKPIVYVADVFSNKEETIQLYYGSEMNVHYESGYTKLIAIVPEGNAIRVVLGKE